MSYKMYIEDVVSFYFDILILIWVFLSLVFLIKDRLECYFGNDIYGVYCKVMVLKFYVDWVVVLCGVFLESFEWDGSLVFIEIDFEIEICWKGKVVFDS